MIKKTALYCLHTCSNVYPGEEKSHASLGLFLILIASKIIPGKHSPR